ncbi:MAG: hypothetical protein HYZ25_21520 [Chloroflexi bacterium]|nr:hypothetical protein [Chloroflexota bacterium]
MSNAADLRYLFKELIEQGKINQHQIENKAVVEDMVQRKSIFPSIIITFMLWGVLLFFWPYYYYSLRFNILGIGFSYWLIFIIVSPVVRWVIKKRIDNQ